MSMTRIIAIGLATALAASATSAAWAARGNPPQVERGAQTYLPGEGGCREQAIYWSHPCGD
jgi:hypothetical protein